MNGGLICGLRFMFVLTYFLQIQFESGHNNKIGWDYVVFVPLLMEIISQFSMDKQEG